MDLKSKFQSLMRMSAIIAAGVLLTGIAIIKLPWYGLSWTAASMSNLVNSLLLKPESQLKRYLQRQSQSTKQETNSTDLLTLMEQLSAQVEPAMEELRTREMK